MLKGSFLLLSILPLRILLSFHTVFIGFIQSNFEYPTELIRKEIFHELETPNEYFSDHTINHFMKLVRKTTSFDMIDVLFYYYPELYQECDSKVDIQIIYGGEIGEIGHFICIFYSEQVVYVYDSLNRKSLHERQMQIINFRYPKWKTIIFAEPKTTQIDDTSCGPLTIAYATMLILGEDPAKYIFKMDVHNIDHSHHLRQHIQTMFENKKLSHFPKIEYEL